jgi:hypothetical protein
LIKSAQKGGFFLDSVLFQMPPRNSLKSYLHYEKSAIGDYFLRFRKRSTTVSTEMPLYSLKEVETQIENVILDVLKQRGESTGISFLYNCIDEELAKHYLYPLEDPSIVNQIFEKLVYAQQISINIKHKVGLSNSEGYNIPALTQKITDFLTPLLDSKKTTNSILYNRVYKHFNGWNTPDRRELAELIEKIKYSHSTS